MTNNHIIKGEILFDLLLKVLGAPVCTYLAAYLSHVMPKYIHRPSLHFKTTKLLLAISCMFCFVKQVQLPSRVCIDVAHPHSLLWFGCCTEQHRLNIIYQ